MMQQSSGGVLSGEMYTSLFYLSDQGGSQAYASEWLTMRYNEHEIKTFLKSTPANLEGYLTYYDPKEGAKRRKAKLVNSILALFKVSASGVYEDSEPSEVVVLSNVRVSRSQKILDGFDIVCLGDSAFTTYSFRCQSAHELVSWVTGLQSLSYSAMNAQCVQLQKQILQAKIKVAEERSLTFVPRRQGLPSRIEGRARPSPLVPSRPAPAPPARSRPSSDEPANQSEVLLIDFS